MCVCVCGERDRQTVRDRERDTQRERRGVETGGGRERQG